MTDFGDYDDDDGYDETDYTATPRAGSPWLLELADVCRAAGLRVLEYDGWETRARSSGAIADLMGVVVHHTASDTTPQNDADYIARYADAAPIAQLFLDRDGVVWVIAAGAANHAGKGGPYTTSAGVIPLDSANTRTIGIEAANTGVGEPWPTVQTDAYVRLVAALCDAYGLTVRDVLLHATWAETRKIDPAGPSPWASGSATWNLEAFRTSVAEVDTEGDEPLTDDDFERIRAIVRDELNTGAAYGSGGDPAYPSAWAETNAKQARSVQELINRTGGPPAEWLTS